MRIGLPSSRRAYCLIRFHTWLDVPLGSNLKVGFQLSPLLAIGIRIRAAEHTVLNVRLARRFATIS
jgi:hypothetical protein